MLLDNLYQFANSIHTEQYSIHHEAVNDKQNNLLRSGVLISSLVEMTTFPVNKSETFKILTMENSTGMLAFSAAINLFENGVSDLQLDILNSESSTNLFEIFDFVKELITTAGGKIQLNVIEGDPICSFEQLEKIYDLVLIDPPFGRYPDKNHPYPSIISKYYIGNAYLSCAFLAAAIHVTKDGGQLLAITPRTYTSGDYSTGFREYLSSNASIVKIKLIYEHINLNHQTLLSSIKKCSQQDSIAIQHYSLEKNQFLSDIEFSAEDIIKNDPDNNAIYVPLTQSDMDVIKEIESFPLTFEQAGYQISTGPIIVSQHPSDVIVTGKKEFHKNFGIVPLINLHNIKTLMTNWNGNNPKDKCVNPKDLSIASKLIPNQPYVFLRRINAGFRTQKLTASIYNPFNPYRFITVENHINYITKKNGALKITEAQYIAEFLNSEKCRVFFSCTSGSSQFNAKKLRKLKFPSL